MVDIVGRVEYIGLCVECNIMQQIVIVFANQYLGLDHAFGISSQVAELQLMKDQAEEAGVGVLMGYNKVSNISIYSAEMCHLSVLCSFNV